MRQLKMIRFISTIAYKEVEVAEVEAVEPSAADAVAQDDTE